MSDLITRRNILAITRQLAYWLRIVRVQNAVEQPVRESLRFVGVVQVTPQTVGARACQGPEKGDRSVVSESEDHRLDRGLREVFAGVKRWESQATQVLSQADGIVTILWSSMR